MKPQILGGNSVCTQNTLRVCIELFSLESAMNLSQMVHMLLLSSIVNQYIIKVYHHKFTDKWLKQLSHHSHKGC